MSHSQLLLHIPLTFTTGSLCIPYRNHSMSKGYLSWNLKTRDRLFNIITITHIHTCTHARAHTRKCISKVIYHMWLCEWLHDVHTEITGTSVPGCYRNISSSQLIRNLFDDEVALCLRSVSRQTSRFMCVFVCVDVSPTDRHTRRTTSSSGVCISNINT